MRILSAIALLALLGGCPKAPHIRDGIAALDGFLSKAQDNHEAECKANPSKPICKAINRAGAVQNAAGDFLKIYCEGPREPAVAAFRDGGPCIEEKGLGTRADAVLRELRRTIEDLKAVIGK